ncbi:hypothetical protein BCR44DRAFT_1106526 [Catenaria anguillulae PL171]|uniref:PH domain-containing protein n=1 Tax=Catenaria anguillulae PL171 TaxID=765915 RepID=A0A1Y2HMD1_9FUNG|nr:hypothetical protein BCR44DRAFT_1106526 [Catenaria anguillulae PL171]
MTLSQMADAHMMGVFPTKRGDRFFSTWKSHKISVCLRQGLVSISPHDLNNPSAASFTNESFLRFHPDICVAQVPGLRNCIRLCQINSSKNWIVQLGSDAEHQHWTSSMQAKLETASIKRDLQEVDEMFAAARRISGTPASGQQQQSAGGATATGGAGGGHHDPSGPGTSSAFGVGKRVGSHSPHVSNVRGSGSSASPGGGNKEP